MNYIGIDLGTSSMKGLLVNEKGSILKTASYQYEVSSPQEGWSEQNPQDWINGLNNILNNLASVDHNLVGGISFGGQMHGLVILDENDNVIRPCILWNDARSAKETEYLNSKVGKETLSELTANIAFAGFTAPKLLWLKENEKDNFDKISKIMLPKDYLIYYLTGKFVTDSSDASGTLFFDVKNRCWSKTMCEIIGINENQLPKVLEGFDVVGKIKDEFNLKNTIVAAGGGDNAAAAIGTGTVNNGACNISLGTSGTIFVASDKFIIDKNNSIHSFAHTNGKYSLMACILSAASCNKWWIENILGSTNYDVQVKGVENKLGLNRVYFLPYLVGERSPHNDVDARSCFIGINSLTTKEEMSLSVLEGVTFALKECLEIVRNNGVEVKRVTLCGGGAKSILWQKIIANILNVDVSLLETEQGPSYGAAILAMVANKEYASVNDAINKIVKIKNTIKPDQELTERYEKKYLTYIKMYPALKDIFKSL